MPWEEKPRDENPKRRRRRRGGVAANKISNTTLAVAVGSSSKNYNSLLE
jgi:hypothetical protein